MQLQQQAIIADYKMMMAGRRERLSHATWKREQHNEDKLRARRIVKLTAAYYAISIADLTSKRRVYPLSDARCVALYLIEHLTETLSVRAMATYIGHHDNSSIYYMRQKMAQRPELLAVAAELKPEVLRGDR